MTRAQLSATMVSAYNTAISDVQSASYYNTADLLTDNAAVALDNLSVAVDSLGDSIHQSGPKEWRQNIADILINSK